MGDTGEAECALGESSSKHVDSFTVWRHSKCLHKGKKVILSLQASEMYSNFTQVLFFFLIFQKHVMTSEKWLDRLVSASLLEGFVISDQPIYKAINKLF